MSLADSVGKAKPTSARCVRVVLGTLLGASVVWFLGARHTIYAQDELKSPDEATPITGRYSRYELEEWNEPLVLRDPVKAWEHAAVVQKSGLVIEDPGYVVKQRYWTLDEKAVGTVVKVEAVRDRPNSARLFVRFDCSPAESPGWTQHEFEFSREIVSTTTGEKRIRTDSAGGATVESSETTVTKERNGQPVKENEVGLIVESTNKFTLVRYPMSLIGRVRPRIGDIVVRGPDWCDGHADGGDKPLGAIVDATENGNPKFAGIVLSERDGRTGYVTVLWKATGRKTSHRFDFKSFYDIQVVPGARASEDDIEMLQSKP